MNRAALFDAVKRGNLLYETNSHSFCHYRVCRDGWTTVYEIAVPRIAQGQGIGSAMIALLNRPIRLKCPVDNKSNGFYLSIGFEWVSTEKGRKRLLNLYHLTDTQ